MPPELEERLRLEAQRCEQPSESVALRLLDQNLPPLLDERREAALAMVHEWMAEDDQTGDPEKAEEFFRNLDAARASNRPLFPPELKGISW